MKKFNVGVKGVIIKGDKVLIVKANFADNFWEVPGGRIDDDETIEQTLERELHEELPNIKNIKVGRMLHSFRVPRDIAEDLSLVLVFYKVDADFEGDDPQISDEHLEWKWATKDEALNMTISGSREAIAKAFES